MRYFADVWKPNLFEGKVFFVTGGAGTICRRMAEAMVLLGADGAIIGRKQDSLESATSEMMRLRKGSKVIGLAADVRDVKALNEAVERTVAVLGRIDFVIAGAAGNFLSAIEDLSSNAFKTVIDIDAVGTYNTLKATMAQTKLNKGSYIFVSALLHHPASVFQAHACAAKAAIDALMRTAALELGPFGVRVNCIAPGAVENTEGTARLMPVDQKARAIAMTPLQRFADISDITDATIFLLSDAAKFITGTITIVDGGGFLQGNSHLPYPSSVLDSKAFQEGLRVLSKRKSKI